MKKLWIVLLSVALIMAFTMPVYAVDVKFSGSYVAQGYYENNRALVAQDGASLSNIWQRLRLQTDFQIQEGLKLTARADVMEKIWGASATLNPLPANNSNGNDIDSQNIKFEHLYVSANIFGGLLRVGYQAQSQFGTAFGDSGDNTYGPRIRYDYPVGKWTFIALWDKIEGTQYYSPAGPSGNLGNPAYQVDSNAEKYVGAFMYDWGKGNAGLLVYYYNLSNTSGPSATPDLGYKSKYWIFDPYVKAQMGPVYFEGEVVYITGTAKAFENGSPDVTRSGWEGYATATYDFAPMYAGITLVYVQGDDPNTTDKVESGAGGGTDFNPCLMLFNYDLGRWEGNMGSGAATAPMAGGIANAQLLQVFVGVKPVPKLDIKASWTYAQADQPGGTTPAQAAAWVSKNYGSELDVTATYKIYDNLSYMIGFAYLWAGDYWKGTNSANMIDNDYLVTHKLTLTF
ncbi:MAG: hypothetical protein ABSE05_02040 [Syntrophales bacterium]